MPCHTNAVLACLPCKCRACMLAMQPLYITKENFFPEDQFIGIKVCGSSVLVVLIVNSLNSFGRLMSRTSPTNAPSVSSQAL